MFNIVVALIMSFGLNYNFDKNVVSSGEKQNYTDGCGFYTRVSLEKFIGDDVIKKYTPSKTYIEINEDGMLSYVEVNDVFKYGLVEEFAKKFDRVLFNDFKCRTTLKWEK